ncbi:glutaminase domain-containing protein [Proteiniphilum sp.]|uniref:glutaminase family protein n=1 Tax=Proteiniphilum sp. TaxID=1926877 RepID=UPI003A599904
MKQLLLLCLAAYVISCGEHQVPGIKNELRAPAYPLVLLDPYTSAWSFSDNLYGDQVKHRTGKEHPLVGAIRVDGKAYRLMGLNESPKKALAAMSYEEPWSGKYTFEAPPAGWEEPGFNDSRWQTGEAAFGTQGETNVKTLWTSNHIWVRRDIQLSPEQMANHKLFLKYSHDDTFELYVNGIKLVETGYTWKKDVLVVLTDEIMGTIEEGKITIAAHCENRMFGGLVDFGIYAEDATKTSLETTARQTSVDVQATQTHYTFECGDVSLKLSFIAPFLPDNLDLVSRPVNYLSYEVTSLDGNPHEVQVYIEAAPHWTVENTHKETRAEGYEENGLLFLKAGSVEQNVLGPKEGSVLTNWGYLYLSGTKEKASYAVGNPVDMRLSFEKEGALNGDVTLKENAYMAITEDLGSQQHASGKIMIGYDDIYSLNYFGTNLRPYWNKSGDKKIESQFAAANTEFAQLKKACAQFDYNLMKEATEAGGKAYAELCALGYRQVFACHKLMESPEGELLFPSKEISSGGFVSTVDVTYPSAPLFLYYNPELLKGIMNPVFYYSESGLWTKRYPAHDVGKYPWAYDQVYFEDMPVEEAGNMLILTAAIAKEEGNAKYAQKHWEVLTTWVNYLEEKGLDPENQLCTDDFAGHLESNTNLSVKAIMGVASYGYLAQLSGDKETGEKYMYKAKEMAQQWVTMADDGDHYRLSFKRPDTWSQKYNMVWDKLMEWNIFPESVRQKEINFYLTKQHEYGLPLDSRKTYTKSDWIVWTATMANDKETFEKFIQPIHNFMSETTDRVPMTDWYYTDSKKKAGGFHARPVVGGYWMKMLDHSSMSLRSNRSK